MEMNEQIEQLSKMKTKVEQDKNKIMAEIADVRAATDEVNRSKASAEKSYKNLLNGLNDLNKKIEETNLNLGDMEAGKFFDIYMKNQTAILHFSFCRKAPADC